MGHRVMFFWTILNKSKSELVRQTVDAMIEFPDDGGWMALVRKDLHFLDIQYSDEYLAMLSKKEISTLVRCSVETRPEVSEAEVCQKITEKCLICQVSKINPEISSSTAIYKT